MALPAGIVTTQITFGTAVAMISAKNLSMSVTFTPTTSLVWAATGTVLIADAEGFTANPGAQGSVTLINPDQAGFSDGNGNTIRNWGYKVEATYADGNTILFTAPPKYITWTAADHGPIDLDQMIPVTASSGITVSMPIVTSVNGHIGDVTVTGDSVSDSDIAEFVADPVSATGAALAAGYAPLTGTRLHVPRIAAAPVRNMVQACTPGHGWTIDGGNNNANVNTTLSNANSTEQVLLGSQSIKLVTNGQGGVTVAASKSITAFDATNCDLRVWLYLPSGSAGVSLVNITVVSAGFANSQAVVYAIGGQTDLSGVSIQPGWNSIDMPRSALGGNVDWTAITSVQVVITDSGVPATVYLGGLAFTQRAHTNLFQTGVLSITADDSFGTQWSVLRPALDAYGWKATLFPIIDQIDGPGNLTMAQVVSLHDDYGWEIAAHASTGVIHGTGWQNMTQSQRLAEAETIKKWQEAHGFDSPSFAYPLGSQNRAAQKDARSYFSVARLAASSHIQPQYPSNPYALDSINIGSQYSQIADLLPKIAAGKAWGSITIHGILASGGTGNDVTPANLTTALAAIASSGVTVLPMGQVIRALAA